MVKTVYAGSLDSESFWRNKQYSKLPAFHDEQRSRIVKAMDELMFPFCASSDGLITRFPMDPVHKAYLSRISFSFEHLSFEDMLEDEHMFQSLTRNTLHRQWISKFKRLSPYAVLENTTELLELYGFEQPLPAYETVQHVNSKMYSAELSNQLTENKYSYPVKSAHELMTVCTGLLKDHKAILVKDPFGVSGKGNLKFESMNAVNRLVSYVSKQELLGTITAFVVEPFLEVQRDFSCQFEITSTGRFHFISMQQMMNHQFAYLGSTTMPIEEQHELERLGYFKVMEHVSSSLYQQGYFGPVCVDSMQLKDGSLIPIVEINARKSMGLINFYLDSALASNRCTGCLTYLSIGFHKHFEYEWLLSELEDAQLLFPQSLGSGIVPLSSATLFVNRYFHEHEQGQSLDQQQLLKGRLYLSVFAPNTEERLRLLRSLRIFLSSHGVKVYD
ncbi:hypothetical protein [Paenibacillus puerhi]|uniref:hypothetical protein n=1 Tax=Paenibacillus puerhi TaxID=2692622 RepID=UPI00135B4182|nr:hypothetical protein [Paenibacillus puerhi]